MMCSFSNPVKETSPSNFSGPFLWPTLTVLLKIYPCKQVWQFLFIHFLNGHKCFWSKNFRSKKTNDKTLFSNIGRKGKQGVPGLFPATIPRAAVLGKKSEEGVF